MHVCLLNMLLLLLMITMLRFKTAYCIDCYECSDVKNITECHHITTCSQNQFCYTDTSGIGEQTRFTLGCRSEQVCLSSTTTTYSSLSIIGRSLSDGLECSQCCAVDSCNKHLCTTGTHAVDNSACEDDPSYNCAQISSVFSICTDKHHAKLVCRQFCGLCHIVPGNWSIWSSWSACDVTCGGGTKSRSRACDNPAPKYGGLPCTGPNTESTSCNLRSCPVHGGWSLWTTWGSCSVTCGIGLERRDRACSNPYPGPNGDPCYGDARDDRACFLRPCADGVWSLWSTWSTCSVSCLGGVSKRNRRCNNPTPSPFGHDCVGNDVEIKSCNSFACPGVNGHWSTWTRWGSCTVTCAGGTKKRTRTCTNPAPSGNGRVCIGNSEDKDICNTGSCLTVNGHWSTWTRWGTCSVTCAGGTKKRTRTCTNPAPSGNGRVCIGNSEDKDICNTRSCPNWTSWSSWGQCSEPCGTGMKERTRTCTSSLGCIGSAKDKYICNVGSCPDLHVRLVGGSSSHRGRVEVSVDGTHWGTVCDDSFSNNGAKVVCKMLGYSSSNARADTGVSPGSGSIYLDDVMCTGDESSLIFCSHSLWGTNNCGHAEDIGVICA